MSSEEFFTVAELESLVGLESLSDYEGTQNYVEPFTHNSNDTSPEPAEIPAFLEEVTIAVGNFTEQTVNQQESETNEGTLKKTRKRRRNTKREGTKRQENRMKRMKGLEYDGFESKIINKDGKDVNQVTQTKRRLRRQLKPRCDSVKCQIGKAYKCQQILEEERRQVFDNYWENMTWGQKKVYICSLMTCYETKTKKGDSNRKLAVQYHIILENVRLRVCKKMFLNTFGVGEWQIHNWKVNSTGGIPSIPVVQVQEKKPASINSEFLKEFLELLPKMPSHYCRQSSTKLYLEPVFDSKSHLYNIYKEKCVESEKTSVSRFKFDQLVEDMNISLFSPKKDKCDICCGFESKQVNEADWQAHILRKDRARKEKESDKLDAIARKSHVLTIDLQAVKVAPFLKASALYYKTKLCVHNFTVYNIVTHECTCYWWDECEADLVASTYASCLIDFLKEHFNDDIPIIIYSDGCTAQNRNYAMSNALLNFAMISNKTIIQKYLEKGHTQMECDSVHSVIENKLKRREIHVPSDYVTAAKIARSKPMPYDCKILTHEFFSDFSVKHCVRYKSIRPGTEVGDPVVVDLRALKYDESGIIQYKLDLDAQWEKLPRKPKNVVPIAFPPLYSGRLPIWNTKNGMICNH